MAIQLIPYLTMDGNAREAISFYEKVLEAKAVNVKTFGEMPSHPDFTVPPGSEDRITYAELRIGDSILMFSDAFPGNPPKSGTQLSVCISMDDPDKAKRIFEALEQGGEITMPMQNTFFSPAYGIVTDKFGVMFQVFTEQKE